MKENLIELDIDLDLPLTLNVKLLKFGDNFVFFLWICFLLGQENAQNKILV
jgi:hypothetical protein